MKTLLTVICATLTVGLSQDVTREEIERYERLIKENPTSSEAHFRLAELFFRQSNYQASANEFREALNGDLKPRWTEVWSHINLGKIFDTTKQRERALNEYRLAKETKDDTRGAQGEVEKYSKEPYQHKQ